jgi:predicted enzyme related to lactoylglutathione lyase
MAGNFIWYELMTPDPDASKTFYDAVVGWDIEQAPAGPMDYRMIRRSDGGNAGGVLRLTHEMTGHGARPTWLGYIDVDDVNAKADAIAGAGGTIMMPPFDIPDIGRIAMVTDPAGAPFYIIKPTPPDGQPDGQSDVFSVDQPQHIRWNELASADQDGTIEFFKSQFGWVQDGAMPMGPMGDYKFIFQNGVRTGAVMRKPEQLPVSMWTFYIGVDDIDRAASAVTQGGGQILHGPIEIPGGEYSIHGLDPQGASFGLVGSRK